MIKTIAVIAALVCSFLLKAQDGPAVGFTFNHLALSVKDVDRAAEFYKNVLQLTEITNRTKKDGIRWMSLGEGKELHLISLVKEPVTINKAVHLALTTPDFDALVNRLTDLKIAYSDYPGKPNTVTIRADGVKQIYLQDPDGYWIEINNVVVSPASVQETKNEIWQKEEDYWSYVKENNLDAYRKLWDEQFIGYPSNNNIAGKDHITDWITDLYKDKSQQFSYQLTRKVENVFGSIVITLYDVLETWTNEKKEVIKKLNIKITHTWKKTDKGWLIIGGMGANK
jgi:catechol 2,3-dioxygenase-like lactoylglutathione lyase family enzyme